MTTPTKCGRPSGVPRETILKLRTAYATLVRTGKPVNVTALAKKFGMPVTNANYHLFKAKDA